MVGYGRHQLIGAEPIFSRYWFAVENGFDPKKPLYADSGEGWADLMIGVFPSKAEAVAASRPQRIATSGTGLP